MSRWHEEGGATAVEYMLIASSIAAILVLVLSVLGRQAQDGLCAGSSAMSQVDVVTQTNPNCP